MKKILILVLSLLLLFSFVSCVTTGNTATTRNPSISVSATATVEVVPDTASFSITAESIENTTEEARNKSASMIAVAVEALKDEFKLSDDEFSTSYMNISPYYEWVDSARVLRGQKATQSITVTLKNDLNKAGKVYDRLSILDGISISSINYSKYDTSSEMEKAREEASKAALKKASAYARGLGKEVGNPVEVSDGSVSSYSNSRSNSDVFLAKATAMDETSSGSGYVPTTYYTGELSVSASVSIVFELK